MSTSVRIHNFDEIAESDKNRIASTEHELWEMGAFETYLSPVTELTYVEMGHAPQPSVEDVLEVLTKNGFKSELLD